MMAKMLKASPTPEAKHHMSSALLGSFVHAKRTQLGLKMEEAAAFCGVAKDTLMKVEHGHPNVKLASVLRICHGLGIQLQVVTWKDEDSNDAWV